jgi:hypothetical protein
MANRRPQLRREETRALFIEAGRAILKENGLGAGGDVLTLKRARDRVESDFGVRFVNASLIGRIWKDQFDYQTEVLATIAADDSTSEIEDSLDKVTSMLANLDVRSEASRRWSLQEMCRVVSGVHLDTLRASTDWALWIAILATSAVGSVPSRRQRIDPALRKSYEDVTTQMEAIYTSLLEFIGFRVRSGLTVRQFAIAAAALTEGCVLRDRVDQVEMRGILRPTGRFGEDQEWTLFGLALHGLAEQFFVVNDEWEHEHAGLLEATDADGAAGPELV